MKALLIAVILAASPAFAASAFWTGAMRFVTTMGGQQAIACEYAYAGQRFWMQFPGQWSCPSSVQVP